MLGRKGSLAELVGIFACISFAFTASAMGLGIGYGAELFQGSICFQV